MIVQPKVRGFICTTAHPQGCAAHVQQQIAYTKQQGALNGCKKVLVIGASTGYGLASRIVAAFGAHAQTIGVSFEKQATENKRTASAGWYNTAAFETAAHAEGLYAKSLNGDAFSNELKQQTIDLIKQDWQGDVDLVIYSLASPRRQDPQSGEIFNSVLKPIGKTYTNKTVDVMNGVLSTVNIEPASDDEIAQTVKVMGGEDWQLWMQALMDADVLAPNVRTVAYSYIGPELTFPIYNKGTIGKAKEDLQNKANLITEQLATLNGHAYISVNKGLVTQASSAIPVVPLYMSLLYKVMKEKDLHEGCIEQMNRLFHDYLCAAQPKSLDEAGRIRLDDWEMRDDIQQQVAALWNDVTSDNLLELSDVEGYREEFYRLFGFGLANINYDADVNIDIAIPSLASKHVA